LAEKELEEARQRDQMEAENAMGSSWPKRLHGTTFALTYQQRNNILDRVIEMRKTPEQFK
jgi:hypothetical protein